MLSRLSWYLNYEDLFGVRYYCVSERVYDKFNTPDLQMKSGTKHKHVREFDVFAHISKLSDKDLLEVFELTIRRYCVCM